MLQVFFLQKIRVFRVHPCPKTTMTDVVIQAENLSGALTQRHQATKGLPDFLRAFVTWWFLSPAARQADYPGYRLEAV